MRLHCFNTEAGRCRELAREFKDRGEGPFLVSLAEAFQALDTENTLGAGPSKNSSIRLF